VAWLLPGGCRCVVHRFAWPGGDELRGAAGGDVRGAHFVSEAPSFRGCRLVGCQARVLGAFFALLLRLGMMIRLFYTLRPLGDRPWWMIYLSLKILTLADVPAGATPWRSLPA
jgi:hypothetical protein